MGIAYIAAWINNVMYHCLQSLQFTGFQHHHPASLSGGSISHQGGVWHAHCDTDIQTLSYLVGIRCFAQVDPLFGQFIPDQYLELQFGISNEVITIGEPGVVVARAGGLVPEGRGPGELPPGSPQLPLLLRLKESRTIGATWVQRLQGEIVSGGLPVVRLSQPRHGAQQPVSVVLYADTDGIEVRLPNLLANFQVVISIIHKRLHILSQL